MSQAPAKSAGVAGIAAIIAAVSLFWIAAETHYGACVDAQVAKYPAIPVSAIDGDQTGPLKLSYDAERREAVEGCKRFLIV